MTDFYEILSTDNPLCGSDRMAWLSDSELAYWLAVDASEREPWPGNNNHLAATREAARRLYERSNYRDDEWAEFGKRMYALGLSATDALSQILYKKDNS